MWDVYATMFLLQQKSMRTSNPKSKIMWKTVGKQSCKKFPKLIVSSVHAHVAELLISTVGSRTTLSTYSLNEHNTVHLIMYLIPVMTQGCLLSYNPGIFFQQGDHWHRPIYYCHSGWNICCKQWVDNYQLPFFPPTSLGRHTRDTSSVMEVSQHYIMFYARHISVTGPEKNIGIICMNQ